MAVAVPTIASYGSSYGKYKGNLITDYEVSSLIDSSKLNKNLIIDGVEFNAFEETIKDYVQAQLGHPVVRVELTPFQIKTCVDEAITKIDYHCPYWSMQYAVFDATAYVNVYELPLFIINNLNYVVYKKDLLAFQSYPGSFEFDFFLGFWNTNRFYQNLNIGDYLLIQQYMEQIRKILSREGSWNIINGKYLQLSPMPVETPYPVILEYRALDSDTIHPAYRNWIQKYALACSKGILGQIRSKYESVPGPGGGARLNGQLLLQESKEDKEKLMEELLTEIEEPPLFTAF